MAKFVLVYHGGEPGATKEEQDKIMATWGKWFEELGDALVDGGNPFGPPKTVTSSGVSDNANGTPATGYSVIEAKDQTAAAELAKGCPILVDNSGTAVEVYEALPM